MSNHITNQEALRILAWNTPFDEKLNHIADAMDLARDCIEENERLRAERDAAVADLNLAPSCRICVNHNTMSCVVGIPCRDCATRCQCIDCKNWIKWQWRGVQHDNSEKEN